MIRLTKLNSLIAMPEIEGEHVDVDWPGLLTLVEEDLFQTGLSSLVVALEPRSWLGSADQAVSAEDVDKAILCHPPIEVLPLQSELLDQDRVSLVADAVDPNPNDPVIKEHVLIPEHS